MQTTFKHFYHESSAQKKQNQPSVGSPNTRHTMLTVLPIIAYCERMLFCGAPAVFDANYQYLGKVVAGIIYRGLQKITVSLGQSQYVTFCIQELMLYLTTLL
jgi:hypothetical protein